MAPPFTLAVPRLLYEEVLAQALAERPHECCGLLAGVVSGGVGRVSARYPLANAAASPTRYRGDDDALFAAHKDMRARGLEMLAVYHSHPTSDPVPSRTDREEWFQGPEVVCLIVSLTTSPPAARGWWLTETDYHEAEWEVLSGP